MAGERDALDLGAALGADAGTSIQMLTLYLPSRDKTGRTIRNRRRWIEEALSLLSDIGGGAISFPPADGAWKSPRGELIREKIVIA